MNKKFVLIASAMPLLCVGFALGYIYQARELNKKNLLIANTVGNNLSEMNRLYTLLNKQGLDYRQEQIKFNLDLLTITDCGAFIKDIQQSTAEKDAPYLIKGLEDTFRALESSGVKRERLVLCDEKVLALMGKR